MCDGCRVAIEEQVAELQAEIAALKALIEDSDS